ncbi:hypothetical protein CEXT_575881 [Caerostris extrusa]|uniref:Uncharacterized protein n=1 Tax=Caerostris extrusa TaxID=172846 RepID=A0AAV4R9Z1_CAEEX|nr:hypothetical protein CEXT_575881 [Caerostris extrusa]
MVVVSFVKCTSLRILSSCISIGDIRRRQYNRCIAVPHKLALRAGTQKFDCLSSVAISLRKCESVVKSSPLRQFMAQIPTPEQFPFCAPRDKPIVVGREVHFQRLIRRDAKERVPECQEFGISSRRSLFCVASIVLRSIMPLGRAAVIRNWATDEQQPQLLTGVPLL